MSLKLRPASRHVKSTARPVAAKRKGPPVRKKIKVSTAVVAREKIVEKPIGKESAPERKVRPVAPPPVEAAPVPVPEPVRPVPVVIDDTPRHAIGEHVVYPGVGVCEVMQIESRRSGDSDRRYYVLRVLSDRARIFLPVANAPRVGLRGIISTREITGVYNVLKNQFTKRIKDWKKRQALITEKVASGDPLKAAEVYKRLFFLSKTKGLSHGENVAFVKVRTILADELSIVSGVTKESMISKIDKILEANYKKRGGMESDEEE
ncbi:MAG: CarD family transcriptional regulator [Acidobacteriota bacterium]